MNIKQYTNIFSPKGKITRTRYVLYAFLLDLLYKFFSALGVYFREQKLLCTLVVLFLVFVVILKLFNYKKRAYSFLNNNILAYLYSFLYLAFGGFIQEYNYLLDISNKKLMYELTQNPIFQQYMNMYVPPFITSKICFILFNIVCGLGLIMFLFLLFCPTTTKELKIISKLKKIKVPKIKNLKKYITIILTVIIYCVSTNIVYSEIKTRCFYRMTYVLSQKQVKYINHIYKNNYLFQMKQYNLKKRQWEDCLNRNKSYEEKIINCGMNNMMPGVEPEVPIYYPTSQTHPNLIPILEIKDFDEFGCTMDNYNLFSNHCGQLKFNQYNPSYEDFHPYLYFWSLVIILLPLSFFLTKFIIWFLIVGICLIKKINIKNFIKKIKNIKCLQIHKASNLSKKLIELNSLKEQGLITEDDYNKKKAELLKDF